MDGRKQQFGGYATHSLRARRRRPPDALVTDDWPAYQDLPGVRHNAITLGPMAAHIALSWIHRLFSNLKCWGVGVYHGTAEAKPSALPR